MNLYLSRYTHMNSVYMLESGQVLYKVVSPLSLGARTSTVYKVLPNTPNAPRYDRFDPKECPTESKEEDDDEKELNELSDEALKDKFSVIGSVVHKGSGKSVLNFNGQSIEAESYFKKDGYHFHGYHRVFTGPDGREYKWYMRTHYSQLCLNDKAQTSVARYHRKSFGIFGPKHPAYLEISEEGLHMLDTILITFVYIERKRDDD